jgi:glutamine amidotransferase
MCRWIAYKGLPVPLDSVICAPRHSLIHQSQHATECKSHTNGDGFGIGWYGDHDEPGLYREVLPAWSDENLRHIARHIRSRFFFAHVRASTGTPTSRVNCHPFAHNNWMFMHNGQIGAYGSLRRKIESMIPDHVYSSRQGTTDSEAIFLSSFARGLEKDPVAAITATLCELKSFIHVTGSEEPLRFTAALANGRDLFAFRYSSDESPPSLYYKLCVQGLIVVSEPLDDERDNWLPVPAGHALIAREGVNVQLAELSPVLKRAVA